jgi:hypothetical protein
MILTTSRLWFLLNLLKDSVCVLGAIFLLPVILIVMTALIPWVIFAVFKDIRWIGK